MAMERKVDSFELFDIDGRRDHHENEIKKRNFLLHVLISSCVERCAIDDK